MGRRTGRTKKKNKGQNASLGRAVIRRAAEDRRKQHERLNAKTGFEIADMEAANRLTSVTQVSSLEDFMATAVAEGRDFTAIRTNSSVIIDGNTGATLGEETPVESTIDHLRIPRRPDWELGMQKEELHKAENLAFLRWRRGIAQRHEADRKVNVTPFEKNLHVWRQLWRVIERSDVIVQIVDSRNPLLFWCPDVFTYAKEINPNKAALLIINKADYLTVEMRKAWAKYFQGIDVNFVFFSARKEQKMLDEAHRAQYGGGVDLLEQHLAEGRKVDPEHDPRNLDLMGLTPVPEGNDEGETPVDSAAVPTPTGAMPPAPPAADTTGDVPADGAGSTDAASVGSAPSDASDIHSGSLPSAPVFDDGASEATPADAPWHMLSREELLELLETKYAGLRHLETAPPQIVELCKRTGRSSKQGVDEGLPPQLVCGMVGYPNVGKSSTINVLLGVTASTHGVARVAVGATPGKTKHFQTLKLTDGITLCDCPGLVFPSFMSLRADMVLNGVLPIDQLRDHNESMALLCRRIPRKQLQEVYPIELPRPRLGEDPNRNPTHREFLDSYCVWRGFMGSTHSGPDHSRAARIVLKEYVVGKLLYCHPPPGYVPPATPPATGDAAVGAGAGAGVGAGAGAGSMATTGGAAPSALSASAQAANVLLPSASGVSKAKAAGAAGEAAVLDADDGASAFEDDDFDLADLDDLDGGDVGGEDDAPKARQPRTTSGNGVIPHAGVGTAVGAGRDGAHIFANQSGAGHRVRTTQADGGKRRLKKPKKGRGRKGARKPRDADPYGCQTQDLDSGL